mmetsp:Transcript_908/g.1377  ORF Transcript_908/g.1377 Transcript_908/m.1377 type:complete len:674 (+) Transcript_908:149-2170(+)
MPSKYNQGSIIVTEEDEEQQPVESSISATDDQTNNDSQPTTRSSRKTNLVTQLSLADLEICQRLDQEYERALEEGQVGYLARYQSVRQAALASILVCFLYLVTGTAFFTHMAGWEIHEALFFSIYTMTTVGYGIALDIPEHPVFQLFCIFYIFTGVAILTIMAAQVYQFVALEASRAQQEREVSLSNNRSSHSRHRRKIKASQRGRDGIMKDDDSLHSSSNSPQRKSKNAPVVPFEMDHEIVNEDAAPIHWWDKLLIQYERFKLWLRTSPVGSALQKTFPFAGLILIGAIVVGPIEGWGPMESLYFACVSLTTVGYGVFVPKNTLSIYFCIVWLPFSVGFMSLFLANIASFYIRMSDKNVRRLERLLRQKIQRQKERQQQQRIQQHQQENGQDEWHHSPEPSMHNQLSAKTERDSISTSPSRQSSGFARLSNSNDNNDPLALSTARSHGEERRQQILDNHYHHNDKKNKKNDDQTTMQTMRDVLRTVRRSSSSGVELSTNSNHNMAASATDTADSSGSSSRSSSATATKPTFALRIFVQERLAEIIAIDIAGYQSRMEIKDTTLSVTMDILKEVADKWCIPRKARKAFRQVSFQVLLFVGEHPLITKGASCLLDDLTLFEFHDLFAPLLAAMGDSLEVWLEATQVLAEVELGAEQRPVVEALSEEEENENEII